MLPKRGERLLPRKRKLLKRTLPKRGERRLQRKPEVVEKVATATKYGSWPALHVEVAQLVLFLTHSANRLTDKQDQQFVLIYTLEDLHP